MIEEECGICEQQLPSDGSILSGFHRHHGDCIEGLRKTLAATTAERDALQRHFDAAAPEHNLPALLDLYFERQQKAEKERDEAQELLAQVLKGDAYEPYDLITRIAAHLAGRQTASNPSADTELGS